MIDRKTWLKKFGVDGKDALRLERALCTIVDLEGAIGQALAERGNSVFALHDMCDALRLIVDGWEE